MTEAGQSDDVVLKLGSTIAVVLVLPSNAFEVLRFQGVGEGDAADVNPDKKQAHQNRGTVVWDPAQWADNSTPIKFEVQCLESASCGTKLCKAWIQEDGVAKAVLEFSLLVSRAEDGSDVVVKEVKPAFQRLTALVMGKSKTLFNLFLSYRVWCEANTAEKLCFRLLASSLDVFWDKICLPDGAPWEDCFRIGLRRSEHVVALLSADTLDGMVSNVQTGRQDNVLLEYELALEETEQNPGFLLLVLVGGARKTEDGGHELYSKTKEEWVRVDSEAFPEVYSVTCGKRTVKETFNKLFSLASCIVNVDPNDPSEGVAKILDSLGKPRVPLPKPVGETFKMAFMVSHPSEAAITSNIGFRLLADKTNVSSGGDATFGWRTHDSGNNTEHARAIESVSSSNRNVLVISKRSLEKLRDELKLEPAKPNATMELIERCVDRLQSEPQAITIVLVGEYVQIPDQGPALVWFRGWHTFGGDVCSATCQSRTIKETFTEMFKIQGIHADPKNPSWAVHRIRVSLGMHD